MRSTADPPATPGLSPRALTGLAGIACAACCAILLLLGAGVLGGAGWAAAGKAMPGVAVVLAMVAVAAWRWASHRGDPGCSGGDSCGCGASADHDERKVPVPFEW